MKKVITCMGGLALSCAVVSTVFAGAIDNKTNWSAEYIRTLNRNAATDYADSAVYNPAGTVKLHDGFSINASVQYVDKDYANNITLGSYVFELESDEPSFIPGLFAVYNNKSFSIFGSVTNVGGGGKVEFNEGNFSTFGITLQSVALGLRLCPYDSSDYPSGGVCASPASGLLGQQLTAESFYIGYTLGAAYALNDTFSFSAGLRYVNASKELQASVTLLDGSGAPYVIPVSFEQEGDGWGGIFGINIAPNDKLNIGMRYETKTDLDFEATVSDPAGPGAFVLANIMSPPIRSGFENPRDLPAIFAFGLSYWLNPQLRVETNYTHYFNDGDANWAGKENFVDGGFDVGIALEYHFSDTLLFSIGYLRTETGIEPAYMLPESPELDANTIGVGFAHAITENLHTNIAMGYASYEDDTFASAIGPVEYEKRNIFLALGLEYRF